MIAPFCNRSSNDTYVSKQKKKHTGRKWKILHSNTRNLICQALKSYGLVFRSLEIEPVSLTTYGKHGDVHFKILIDGHPYSIRLLPEQRYTGSALSHSTTDTLALQLRYTDYLRVNGIPFMECVKPTQETLFTIITDSAGQKWRCCLFHWMDGHHVTPHNITNLLPFNRSSRRIWIRSTSYGIPINKSSESLITNTSVQPTVYRIWPGWSSGIPGRKGLSRMTCPVAW